MLKFIKKLRNINKLMFVIIIFALGFGTFKVYFFSPLTTLKTKGPIYANIVPRPDPTTGVFPTPEYLANSYAIIQRLTGETDPEKITYFIGKGRAIRSDYEQFYKYWLKGLNDAKLEEVMVEQSYRPAMEFFDLRDREFVPAIVTGNTEKAKTLARGALKQKYREYQKKINDIFSLVAKRPAEPKGLYRFSTPTTILIIIGLVMLVIVLGLEMSTYRRIKKPLGRLAALADRLAEGDTGVTVEPRINDELGPLFSSFGRMTASIKERSLAIEKIASGNLNFEIKTRSDKDVFGDNLLSLRKTLRGLTTETQALAKAAAEGQLSKRGDAEGFKGEFKEIVQQINDVLNSVTAPLQVIADYIERIARGHLPSQIPYNYKGDFEVIKNNLNTCLSAINLVIDDTDTLAKATGEGQLNIRIDVSRHQGDYHKIVQRTNEMLDAITGPLSVIGDYIERLAQGDISSKITYSYSGALETLKNNLNTCIDALNRLTADMETITRTATEGTLARRIDLSKHQGNYRTISQSINDALDAITGPLNVISDYVERIARGDISSPITYSYSGTFEVLKNNLNTCIDTLNRLTADMENLPKTVGEGELARRIDLSKYPGNYRTISRSINDTLDAINAPLNVISGYIERIAKGDASAKISETYPGTFGIITNNLNACIDAINHLVDETANLVKAVSEGKLSARSDPSRHQGDFQNVLQDINHILGVVIKPINEIVVLMEKVAARDLTVRITGDYPGDYARIKDLLNAALDSFNQTIQEVTGATEQVVSAVNQVETNSQTLAQDAMKQAGAVRELSYGLKEMSELNKQHADYVKNAKELVETTCSGTGKGMEKMQALSGSIERLKFSSDRAAETIKTINDIVFQTSHLALNVVAVAEEVRSLALRSEEMAKNTAGLIEESQKNVEGCVAKNQEMMRSLEEISRQAQKVAGAVSEISAASQQQNQRVDQISNTAGELNQALQQNAVSSEDSVSTVKKLSSQAGEVKSMVKNFRLSVEEEFKPAETTPEKPEEYPDITSDEDQTNTLPANADTPLEEGKNTLSVDAGK
ncbi:MAG: HAMP domain-containing protein [Candidatus Omnitrophota bacterium]